VLENIAFPLQVKGVSTQESMQRAKEMVDLVSLTGRENYFPRQLSGGQQQRVGIARSLAIEPDIWFLDEPFSALDPLIRKEMQDEFLRLQRKCRTSFCACRMSSARPFYSSPMTSTKPCAWLTALRS
jgi:glycine betaine/proline transport system ATP-binding protein